MVRTSACSIKKKKGDWALFGEEREVNYETRTIVAFCLRYDWCKEDGF